MSRNACLGFKRISQNTQPHLSTSRSLPARSPFACFSSLRREWADVAQCRFMVLVCGLMLCLHTAASAQTSETFTNADGNNFWSDGNNWSPPTAQGGPNGNYNITVETSTAPILDVSVTIVNLTIDAFSTLWVTNSNKLTITGPSILNDGQLTIGPLTGYSTNPGYLVIDNTVTLFGTGSTYLGPGSFSTTISGTGTLINAQILSGSGHIGIPVQNQSQIMGGTPAAPLIFYLAVTNTGEISGFGNTVIEFYRNTVQNTGGTIDATDTGEVLLNECTITGGTIGSASASGSTPTLNGVTITGTYSVVSTSPLSLGTTLQGTITNNGQIVVTSAPGYANAQLNVSGAVTLQGTGQVSMTGSNAVLYGLGNGATLTNASPHIISGGNIKNLATLTNQSQLNQQLNMQVTDVENFNASIYAPELIDGGTVNGGTIQAADSGTTVEGGTTISSATISGGSQGVMTMVSGTLNADTIATTVQVSDGGKLTLKGVEVINSPGEIFVDANQATATLVDSGAVTLSGTGQVTTSTSPGNVIVGGSGTKNSLTINVPTVTFQGTIGDGSTMNVTIGAPATVTNNGYPLIFNVGSNHTFSNQGTLVEGDSTIEILGNFKNYSAATNTLSGGNYQLTGTLQFDNANIITDAANVTFTGSAAAIVDQNGNNGLLNLSNITSKGTFSLSGSNNFRTAGNYSNGGKSIVASGSLLNVGGTSTDYTQSAATAVTTVDGEISVPAGGLTNITGGILQGAGALNGNVSVGNASGGAAATFIVGDSKKASALFTMLNDYTQLATGVMDVQIGGTTAGSQYSQVTAYGPVTLGGTLTATLINKFKPVSGEQFTIINAPAGLTGTFATVNLPANFHVVYNSNSVVLEYE